MKSESNVVVAILAFALIPVALTFYVMKRMQIEGIELQHGRNLDEFLKGRNPLLGEESSRLKLVMFGDYQCKPCRAEWPEIESFQERHRSVTAVYFVHFPLSKIHPLALDAATLSTLSKYHNKELIVHQQLFEHEINESLFKNIIQKYSIVGSKNWILESRKIVMSDYNIGLALGVKETPTIYAVLDHHVYRVLNLSHLPDLLKL